MPMSSVIKRKVRITNRLGMHARPAMAFVDIANRYKAAITVRKDAQVVDGKSIMQMMMLAATQGTDLEIEAAGADAEQAMDKLTGLVERKFDED
jgi:phosphocarrier protein